MTRIIDFADGFSSSTAPSASGFITVTANQDIGASGTIAAADTGFQLLKVTGDGAARTASTTPFSGSTIPDGAVIMIIGQDDTNTLTISHNDANGGCILFGDAVLGAHYMLQLVYDETADRFYEITRNFA